MECSPRQASTEAQGVKQASRKSVLARLGDGIDARIRRNYYLTKLYYRALYLSGSLRKQEPVIIFQPGKVGSSSADKTLRQAYPNRPVFHVHVLNAIDRQYGQICEEINLTPRQYFARSKHLEVSLYLHREIKRGLKGRKWQVISLVRDPLEQKISSFFQLLDRIVPDFQHRYRDGTLTIEALTDIFLQRFGSERDIEDWFDREMLPVFGIDVYASEFPRSKGYQIYRGERADLLLVRLEDLDKSAGEAFECFLGLSGVTLASHNRGATKAYAAIYDEFKQRVILPDEYVDTVYTLRQARHFYTEAEIGAFKAKYRR